MKTLGTIQFIGHSGLSIKCQGTEILIDPWLRSSSFKEPVLRGLLPPNKTIDFQIPEPRNEFSDYSPDAILVSHFHTHHSPFSEISEWISLKKTILGLPEIEPQENDLLKAGLKELYEKVDFRFSKDSTRFNVGPFEVIAHFHPLEKHLIWEVKTSDFSVIHMTDVPANRKNENSLLDVCYEKFENSSPDFLFIGCGAHALKTKKDNLNIIVENTTATPIQGAKIAALIKPSFAGIIGHSNHSIWKNRMEYTLPSHVIEDQFHWALGHLAPNIQHICLRPSQKFSVVKSQIDDKKQLILSI